MEKIQDNNNVLSKFKAIFKRAGGFLLFGNRFKLRNKSATISYMAILVTFAIVSKGFTVPLGGAARFSLTYIPCFVAGIYFGALFAAGVGVIIPVLGFLIFGGVGFPWTLNIISSGLMGVIMALCVQPFKRPNLKIRIIIGAILVCLIVTLGINTIAFMVEPFSPMYGWSYWAVLLKPDANFFGLPRVVVQPLILALNTAITIAVVPALDRAYFNTVRGKSNYLVDIRKSPVEKTTIK